MPKCDFNKVALKKVVLRICSKFTEELSKITLHSSPVNLLHISEHRFVRTPLEGCFCILHL